MAPQKIRCMTSRVTGTHSGTQSTHSGSNSCNDSNLDWYSTVAAGLRLEPSVFQEYFPAAALHLSVWTYSLCTAFLSFNHTPSLRKLRWTSAESRLMKDKTHGRPHMHAEGVRHSCPPAGGIITARSRKANHKLALTWPKDWWEILSTFLHFCFLVSIHFHQLWLSVMSRFHTLSGSAGERGWRKEFNNTPSYDLSLSWNVFLALCFFRDRVCQAARLWWNGVWAVKLQRALRQSVFIYYSAKPTHVYMRTYNS